MSKTLVQPIGQKRLTNVAVVRLKKHGLRFEIACYKNKVLSFRSRVEKDLDEVLQSHTVYSNVSKGVLAKTKDLVAAFGTDDQTKICLEILEKGELQIAGKERESHFSNQFRDITTIVMQKTINPETQRPYTISMIERLMHEIHFAVDPHSSSKNLALEVIRELQKNFPIKPLPMRLRLTVPGQNFHSLCDKLNEWGATVVSKDESGSQLLVGRLEILAVSVHAEGDTQVDHYDDEDISSRLPKESADSASSHLPPESTDSVLQVSLKMQKHTISSGNGNAEGEAKQHKCSTCNAFVGDSKQYRDHFKSEWHKHNLKHKTRQLTPLTAEECLADMEMSDSKSDLQDYSF